MLGALPAAAVDSVIEHEVARDQRLEIRNFKGTVHVVTAPGNRLRVEADHASADPIVVRQDGAAWIVVPASWERDSGEFALRLPDMARVRVEGDEPAPARLVVSIPPWMPLEVESPFSDVTIEGPDGPVEVTAMMGNVKVRGGGSPIRIRAMTGRIELAGGGGRVSLESSTGRIRVRETAGDLRVETTSGDIDLEELAAEDVEAVSIDGDITLRGGLAPNGRFELTTHSGDIDLALAEPLEAWFSVRALTGGFDSRLPIDNPPRKGRGEFTLGDGSARLLLESFSGRIRLSGEGAGGD